MLFCFEQVFDQPLSQSTPDSQSCLRPISASCGEKIALESNPGVSKHGGTSHFDSYMWSPQSHAWCEISLLATGSLVEGYVSYVSGYLSRVCFGGMFQKLKEQVTVGLGAFFGYDSGV